jgi:hypothetical protein
MLSTKEVSVTENQPVLQVEHESATDHPIERPCSSKAKRTSLDRQAPLVVHKVSHFIIG